MAVRHWLEGRLVVVECRGSYEVAALTAAWDEATTGADFPKDACLLLDVRESESLLRRSVRDLRSIADFFVARAGVVGKRTAIVVDGLARYGLMRMAATWAGDRGIDARVFRDFDEAKRWLLEPEPPD